MAPSYGTPPLHQPLSSAGFSLAENPASSVATLASTYPSGGPVRAVGLPSEHYPQVFSGHSLRTAPSFLPPQDISLSPQHLSEYPPLHQAIPTPGPGYDGSPMRQHPSYDSYLPPSRMQRRPVTCLPNNTRGGYYDLDYERDGDKDGDDHDTLEMYHGGVLAEDHANRPVFELRGSSIAGIQKSGHQINHQPESQGTTCCCRLPECHYFVPEAVAARLGGFCCNSHMWSAINRGIATLCPRCKNRACPEGQALCSVCS
ncbi:hypothetical protein EDB87DRAFT_103586 [Lactarius vividus]|nr:hypothetical protein EDB87DRAFT_103586 [Lactarius vividus]